MGAFTSRLAARLSAARPLLVGLLAGAIGLLLRRRWHGVAPEGEEVVDLLLARHRESERLMDDWERATDVPDTRRSTLRALGRHLSIHESVEEQLVHPLVRRQLPDGHHLVVEVRAEEQETMRLLAAIEDGESGSDELDDLVQRLFEGVRHHAHTEETLVFPVLRRHLGSRERMRLGAMVERAERFAPTHPHPRARPGTVGIPVVGVLDRARDRVRH